MNQILKHDLQQLEEILEQVKLNGLDFLNTLDKIPASPKNRTIKPGDLPSAGEGALAALEFFKENYQQLMVSSSGSRYWGYVIGGVTPAAIAGDWLCTVFDQNTQRTTGHGDASAVLEFETIRLLKQLLSIDEQFFGGFVSGANMSNFTGLGVARQWTGKQVNVDVAMDGMRHELKILAAAPHSSIYKSLAMLGIGSNQLIKVKTKMNTESIDLQDLERLLEQYKDIPVILSASAGTVNTADFDDLKGIVALKQKYTFWLHVDAAFGGFAACSPAHKYLLDGINQADSITLDCHKWMNMPYDSAVFFIRGEHKKLQMQTFQNTNAPYLGDPAVNFSFANVLPENSRRFRALPAWFSLMAYGQQGFKDIVENSIQLAGKFGDFIEESEQFSLLAPVKLNTVCFTLAVYPQRVLAFLNVLNRRGNVFLTASVYAGQHCIRAAFVNWRTVESDIELAKKELNVVYGLYFS